MRNPAMNTDPLAENARLSDLYELGILDTPTEERFDRITKFIAQIFHVPICTIGFLADHRIWYKSSVGLEINNVSLTENSFEYHLLQTKNPFYVQNTLKDLKFSTHSLVNTNPKIVSIAMVPLYSKSKNIIGALTIADISPHLFTNDTLSALSTISQWVEVELTHDKVKDTIDVNFQEELNSKNHEIAIANAQNEAVLESIGDGVIVVNDRGEITFMNQQTEELLGYPKEELLGKLIFHAIHMLKENDEEVPITEYPIRSAIYSKQKTTNNLLYYKKKDGSKFAASTIATPILISGTIIGGVVVFRDITKERDVDRMKTEFISLASHQLRTPLSAIKWFTEMLIDGDVGAINKEQAEVITNVHQSNERMIELVNTLLNISRIESGRIIIEPQSTDLKKLVDEVVVELGPKLIPKNHKLAVSVHENMPQILVDQKLVRHVYMNLLTNAIKYTPVGGNIEVIISLSGNEIISQVTDNGYGIPQDQKEKVFTKFFRAKNIIGIETDGTGLGLYLTKAIVESSGGRIWYESETYDEKSPEKKHGTTFWFTLPLSGMPAKKGEVTIDA